MQWKKKIIPPNTPLTPVKIEYRAIFWSYSASVPSKKDANTWNKLILCLGLLNYLSEFFCFLLEGVFPTKLVHTPLLLICSVMLIPVSPLLSPSPFCSFSATGIIMMFPLAIGTAIPPLVTLILARRVRLERLESWRTPPYMKDMEILVHIRTLNKHNKCTIINMAIK